MVITTTPFAHQGIQFEAAVVTKLHCSGNDMGGDAESQKLVAGGDSRRKPIAKDWGSFPVASDAGSASILKT